MISNWQAGIRLLCEEHGIKPDRVLLDKEHHDFKVTASGGAVWFFESPDLQYGGLTERTVVLTREQYEAFLELAGGGPPLVGG